MPNEVKLKKNSDREKIYKYKKANHFWKNLIVMTKFPDMDQISKIP